MHALDKSVMTIFFLSGIPISENARENVDLHAERNGDTYVEKYFDTYHFSHRFLEFLKDL